MPTAAVWLPPELSDSRVGPAAVPVAVKTVDRLPDVAVRLFAPVELPRVQLPIVATPPAPVVWLAPVTLPPPVVMEKTTLAPATGLPKPSCSRTLGATATADATVALCESPAIRAICVAAPVTPVALTLTAAVPATMAVLYLLLIVYFQLQGGYKRVELAPETPADAPLPTASKAPPGDHPYGITDKPPLAAGERETGFKE